MKKALLSIAVITSLGMVACNKENIESTIFDEISSEEESLTLPESDFTITETEPLGDVVDDRYTSGILEYAKNGEVLAVVDYNLQEDEEVSIIKEEGDTSKCDMKKKPRKKGKGKKVVVEPIVKTEDCDYIVSGVVKFFDKEGNWKATVDFGDGSCDDLATKTTAEGTEEFILKKHPK